MYLFGIMLFLAINGHHSLLMAIASSYKLIPVTGAVFSTACPEAVIKMFVSMFALGVKIAAPFITVFVLSDIALGMIARTVPQLNVFMLGFPMKIGLGLVTLLTALPILIVVIGAILKQIEKDLLLIMKIIS